jgi:predicted transcriptional regulator
MNIVLSPETQKLLEDCMRKGSYSTPEETVRAALETLDQVESYDEIDDATLAAIEEGLAQVDSGEVRPLEEVRAEFRAKGLCK